MDAATNLARWLARDGALADDIVQDAMLRAWRAFDGFRGDSSQGTGAKAWLLAIVRNCWRTTRDQTRRRAQVALPEDGENGTVALIADEPDPETAAISGSVSRKLDAVVAQLPEEFRETLILREMEDLSYRQISEVTGAPIGTVMSRLARGRALLREKWLEGGVDHGVQ